MDEIIKIIKEYLFKPKSKNELKKAVNLWRENKEEALNKYGHISNWDTSLITDMSELFSSKKDFNDNINNWDVSSVTEMYFMFGHTTKFNQPLD